MNIGIDIDGTITKYPDFFVELGKAWKARGHKVYIITGLGNEGVVKRWEKYDFLRDTSWYDELITTANYDNYEKSLIGKVQSNEEIVGRFKQRMCKLLNIVVMFDDQAQIHRQFGKIPIFEVK